jgi:hypothetical protein
MQKVVGSSPIIRSQEPAGNGGFFPCGGSFQRLQQDPSAHGKRLHHRVPESERVEHSLNLGLAQDAHSAHVVSDPLVVLAGDAVLVAVETFVPAYSEQKGGSRRRDD